MHPSTSQVCFFHNAMATGCVKGDRCQFVHVKVNLRALGFVGHQPNPLTEAEAARISKLRGMDVGGGVVQQLPPSKGASDTGAKGRRLPSSSKGIGAAAGAQTWGAEATPVRDGKVLGQAG